MAVNRQWLRIGISDPAGRLSPPRSWRRPSHDLAGVEYADWGHEVRVHVVEVAGCFDLAVNAGRVGSVRLSDSEQNGNGEARPGRLAP